MAYQPQRKTVCKLNRIELDLGLKPMRLIHDMLAAGFSVGAVSSKLEIPMSTLRRLMEGKNLKAHPKPTIEKGTRGGSRPWRHKTPEERAQRLLNMKAGIRTCKRAYIVEGKPLMDWLDPLGWSSTSKEYCRVKRRIEKGMTVAEAIKDVKGESDIQPQDQQAAHRGPAQAGYAAHLDDHLPR